MNIVLIFDDVDCADGDNDDNKTIKDGDIAP